MSGEQNDMENRPMNLHFSLACFFAPIWAWLAFQCSVWSFILTHSPMPFYYIRKIMWYQVVSMKGQRFGRWTVLGQMEFSKTGERKWLCRCDCGTERFVLERSLLYGGSQSCGCLRKERAKEAVSADLTGKAFGELTVLGPAPAQKAGGVRWLCRCICGTEYTVLGTLLLSGRRTRCPNHRKNYAVKDIAGQRFFRLTARYPAEAQNGRGIVWHCRCDCGTEIDVPYNDLVYGNMKSCGCQKKEHDAQMPELLTHIDGTCIEALRSGKRPANNTTGYRGIYKIRGKYTVKIVFQKKQYFLGTFEKAADAAAVREKSEQLPFGEAVSLYEAWKKKASADPDWAAEHPLAYLVVRDRDGMPRIRAV